MTIENIFTQFDSQQSHYELTIPKSWSQGRTIYGGISAALAYQAAENLIDDNRFVRALHCNFIGPITCEKPIIVEAEVLRTGKNVTQILAKISQNGQVGVMAQIVFGVNRESKLLQVAQDTHQLRSPKKPKFIPLIPKLVPRFIQHFDYVFDKGDLSIMKRQAPLIHGWTKLTKTPSTMRMAYFIAMMDAWPPTMFQLLKLPVPASTMSWDIEFIAPETQLLANEWIASETEAHHIRNGYGHEDAKFWNENGQLLAKSNQVVAIFG